MNWKIAIAIQLLLMAAPVWGETNFTPPALHPPIPKGEYYGETDKGLNPSEPSPQPSPSGRGSKRRGESGSPFPAREGGWGVRFSEFPNSFVGVETIKEEVTTETPIPVLPKGVAQDLSQAETTPQPPMTPNPAADSLDLKPEIIENSPVLQRWLHQVPNVLDEIRNDPSFRTRVRVGYSLFPSTDGASGFNVGVEDVFIGRTGLTVSGDYQRSFNGKRESFGADLRYYVLPLGSYVNFAPQVGYRNLTTGNFSTDGVNVGARLMLALSRTGAADVSLTQSFVSPGSADEVGITTLSFGYAVTRNLRLSTDIQRQNSREDKDSRVGIGVEWMP